VTKIRIAAVGDVLMWKRQIQSAKRSDGGYSFDDMFREVRPVLKKADLVIGNLETTLSGRESVYQQRNPHNGYPMFNCPDEVAAALRRAGFHILTTANNHCLDRGVAGLRRTLAVLDRHGIAHTGTFRTRKESLQPLIRTVKGIRIGLLSYTYGTNGLTADRDCWWAVNRIRPTQVMADVKRLRRQVDVLIVAMHFGQEFARYPNQRQKELVRLLFNHGVDVVLGAHPHVLQPLVFQPRLDRQGRMKPRFVAYSLGNFISDGMQGGLHSDSGAMVQLMVEKTTAGKTSVKALTTVPTWVHKHVQRGRLHFRVLPIGRVLKDPDHLLRDSDLDTMRRAWSITTRHLGRGTFR